MFSPAILSTPGPFYEPTTDAPGPALPDVPFGPPTVGRSLIDNAGLIDRDSKWRTAWRSAMLADVPFQGHTGNNSHTAQPSGRLQAEWGLTGDGRVYRILPDTPRVTLMAEGIAYMTMAHHGDAAQGGLLFALSGGTSVALGIRKDGTVAVLGDATNGKTAAIPADLTIPGMNKAVMIRGPWSVIHPNIVPEISQGFQNRATMWGALTEAGDLFLWGETADALGWSNAPMRITGLRDFYFSHYADLPGLYYVNHLAELRRRDADGDHLVRTNVKEMAPLDNLRYHIRDLDGTVYRLSLTGTNTFLTAVPGDWGHLGFNLVDAEGQAVDNYNVLTDVQVAEREGLSFDYWNPVELGYPPGGAAVAPEERDVLSNPFDGENVYGQGPEGGVRLIRFSGSAYPDTVFYENCLVADAGVRTVRASTTTGYGDLQHRITGEVYDVGSFNLSISSFSSGGGPAVGQFLRRKKVPAFSGKVASLHRWYNPNGYSGGYDAFGLSSGRMYVDPIVALTGKPPAFVRSEPIRKVRSERNGGVIVTMAGQVFIGGDFTISESAFVLTDADVVDAWGLASIKRNADRSRDMGDSLVLPGLIVRKADGTYEERDIGNGVRGALYGFDLDDIKHLHSNLDAKGFLVVQLASDPKKFRFGCGHAVDNSYRIGEITFPEEPTNFVIVDAGAVNNLYALGLVYIIYTRADGSLWRATLRMQTRWATSIFAVEHHLLCPPGIIRTDVKELSNLPSEGGWGLSWGNSYGG